MRAQLFLLPIVGIVLAQPAQATVYMSVEQAQALMFPGATLSKDFRRLSNEQVRAIEKTSGTRVVDSELRAWRASTGGWFIIDEVVGKHEFIPFALGIDDEGSIRDIEILEYREAYGAEICGPEWRAQFIGKSSSSKLKLTDDIQNISGATLSSKHVTEGVRRLMATYALVLANS